MVGWRCELWHDIEKELEQIYNQKAKGAQIRSREKWVELGEKNNSYFLGLEKQRQVKKSISKLLDENNKVIKELGKILNTIKDYYEKLYTSKKTRWNFIKNIYFWYKIR